MCTMLLVVNPCFSLVSIKMRYRVLPLEELVLNEVNAYQKHFEGHIKQLSDRLMEIIGREIINSQLIDGEKEKLVKNQ